MLEWEQEQEIWKKEKREERERAYAFIRVYTWKYMKQKVRNLEKIKNEFMKRRL